MPFDHYVSDFYLRAFVDPGLAAKSKHHLWIYEKGQEPRSNSPSKIAGADGFYDMGIPGKERLAEDTFSKIETFAAPVLRKLRRGDIGLSASQRGEFSYFLAATLARTTHSRAVIDDVRGTRLSKTENVRVVFDTILEWQDYLSRLSWILCEAPPSHNFVTSDDPLWTYDPATAAGPAQYKGRPSHELQFQCPISPRYSLAGEFHGLPPRDREIGVLAREVALLNDHQIARATRYVFAAELSEELRQKVDEMLLTRPARVPIPRREYD